MVWVGFGLLSEVRRCGNLLRKVKACIWRFLSEMRITDTLYLHMEFTGKTQWSINLPFLCTKCGNCCKLEDFLSAGKINANPKEHPQVHDKVKALFEELGAMWAANEAKYEDHIMHNPCPFLTDKSCAIYEIRPDGCRLFPKTAFGMQSTECEPLTRFKRMRAALKKGRIIKENYYFTGKTSGAECNKPIESSKFNEKQYQTCITKLRQAGMTNDELALFHCLNSQNESGLTA